MVSNGDCDKANYEFYMTITVNVPESKSIVNTSNPTYRVDFFRKKFTRKDSRFQAGNNWKMIA